MLASDSSPHGFCAKVADFGLARNLGSDEVRSKIETVHYGALLSATYLFATFEGRPELL